MAKLFVMFGPSGSGKTSWARRTQRDAVKISVDAWFMDPQGVYRWSADKMEHAHRGCMRQFLQTITSVDSPAIVVDNPFAAAMSAHPYVSVGLAMDYDVQPVVLAPQEGWYGDSVFQAYRRGQHGVPLTQVRQTAEKLNRLVDSWPGFWPAPLIIDPWACDFSPN